VIPTEVRRVVFDSKEQKAAYMQEGAVRDAKNPRVLAVARRFLALASPWARARAILLFCQVCIEYVPDPGEEVLEGSPVVLERGFGDCDAKARLFVALALGAGLEAEHEPIFRGDSFPHVRARVLLGGRWLFVDPSILNSDLASPNAGPPVTNFPGRR
jgi:transglutaminase-like putative cysteine protease